MQLFHDLTHAFDRNDVAVREGDELIDGQLPAAADQEEKLPIAPLHVAPGIGRRLGNVSEGLPQEAARFLKLASVQAVARGQVVEHVFPDVARQYAAHIEDHGLRFHYFFVTPSSASGSQVAMAGKAITTTSATTIMQKNGIAASAT